MDNIKSLYKNERKCIIINIINYHTRYYMNELQNELQETADFFYVSDKEAKDISLKLTEHVQNKLYYNPKPLKVNCGVKINLDYSTKNMRQSFFKDCSFDGVNYNDTGLAGSLFIDSRFYESNFDNTNFQSCDFRNCHFRNINKGFNYTRFSKSIFTDSTFEKCIFNGVLLNDTIFTNCIISNCDWIPVSVENTIFKNTLLQNVKFRKMNFEFSTFDNIKLDYVKLPFPTIPYIYNGLTYLVSTSDNVRITSAKKKEGLSIDEYLEQLDNLCIFYKYTHNYFPLTNILICQKKYKEAFSSIINGVEMSIELRRFRMLRNYCKQLKYICGITMHERQNLYNHILNKIGHMDFQNFEYANLNNYLPEVRQILLDDLNSEKIEVSLSTNIQSDNIDQLSILLNIIEELLHGICEYSMELRHNSPWDIFLTIFSDKNNISLIISSFSMVFGAIQTSLTVRNVISEKKQNRYEQIEKCRNKIASSNITVNLTINNQGNIQINNQINSL